MSKDQKIIRAKVRLLELAKQLGNVSHPITGLDVRNNPCVEVGIHTFLVEKGGVHSSDAGLSLALQPVHISMHA
ncbi:hypothetical protein [Paracoccus sp. (in: a-proteobacteria)]|uniref:hypothetical protein n=1 Tax=Paracoccus sp. TaxID=267 RepID=UPI002AFDDE3F|nr:hypothetical protein [Paracoccus sp. (in: a-proteobacteria)]